MSLILSGVLFFILVVEAITVSLSNVLTFIALVLTPPVMHLCPRHCVSGLGLGVSEAEQGDAGDDNALSPEACYECKLNGYRKKGRSRRSTNGTDEEPHVHTHSQVNRFSAKLLLEAGVKLRLFFLLSSCFK